jgi:predicted porin
VKNLVALAALAATTAFAQSTVTINGVVDVGIRNTSKVAVGAAKLGVTAGNNNRIGFGVVEDLGGGLKATANAEMRFDPAAGTTEGAGARPLFQGQTRVGLMGGFGTVMLGRGLTALQLANGGNSDPWGVTTAAGSVYAAGFATDYAAGGEGRIDQGIWYTSPTMGGLTLSATMSPRKIVTAAGATPSKTSQSINVTYAAGPLVVGLGNERNRANDTITQVYGNYNMGVAKLFASYATIEGGTTAEQAAAGAFAASAAAVNTGAAPTQVAAGGEIKNWTVGATVPMGAATIRVGYSGWNGDGSTTAKDDTKFGVGVKYDLSKRTFIYSNIAQQTRKNFTGTAAAGRDNTSVQLFDLGVGHSF